MAIGSESMTRERFRHAILWSNSIRGEFSTYYQHSFENNFLWQAIARSSIDQNSHAEHPEYNIMSSPEWRSLDAMVN